jgi:hypothetical protein
MLVERKTTVPPLFHGRDGTRVRLANADYWETMLFYSGLILVCSPILVVPFAGPFVAGCIMLLGIVVTAAGFALALFGSSR